MNSDTTERLNLIWIQRRHSWVPCTWHSSPSPSSPSGVCGASHRGLPVCFYPFLLVPESHFWPFYKYLPSKLPQSQFSTWPRSFFIPSTPIWPTRIRPNLQKDNFNWVHDFLLRFYFFCCGFIKVYFTMAFFVQVTDIHYHARNRQLVGSCYKAQEPQLGAR